MAQNPGDLNLPAELRMALEQRKTQRKPLSLFDLAMTYIEDNFERFCHSKDTLENLPDPCSQRLLDAMCAKCVGGCVPTERVRSTLETAMCSRTGAVDLTQFWRIDILNRRLGPELFQHVLRNCSRLTRMRFSSGNAYGTTPPSLLPVLQFKRAWPNLRVLSCNLYCSDETMRLFKDNFPNIEVLEVNLNLGSGDDQFTMKGLTHMSLLKKLHSFSVLEHYFFFKNSRGDFWRPEAPYMYVLIALGVYRLRVLGVCYHTLKWGNWFVEHMAIVCPERDIAIKHITIRNGLRQKWPRKLRVLDDLTIWGYLDDETIENLGGISTPVKLVLENVPAFDIYKLLVAIGTRVQALTLKSSNEEQTSLQEYWVDVRRILRACPNLESFSIDSKLTIVNNEFVYPMTKKHFKKYSRFSSYNKPGLAELAGMFLRGSERIQELIVHGPGELRRLHRALQSNPKWLPKLRTLEIHSGRHVDDDVTDLIVQVVTLLVCKCDNLQKAKVNVYAKREIDIVKMNRLGDMINGVAPSVLKIYRFIY